MSRPASLQHAFWPDETRFVSSGGRLHTASVDWCEPNYELSSRITESINALTTLPLAVIATASMIDVVRQRLPIRTLLPPFGILFVCLGSTWFHATLSKEGQLADELPMLDFTALVSLHVAITRMPDERRSFLDVLVPVLIVGVALASNIVCACEFQTLVTRADLLQDNFVVFAFAFASFLITSTGRGVWLTLNRPISAENRHQLLFLASRGAVYFLAAFGIWNLENLITFRRQFGLIGVLLNGHAAWHLLSNYAAYLLATGACLLNLALTQPQSPVEVVWKLGSPFVRRVKTKSA